MRVPGMPHCASSPGCFRMLSYQPHICNQSTLLLSLANWLFRALRFLSSCACGSGKAVCNIDSNARASEPITSLSSSKSFTAAYKCLCFPTSGLFTGSTSGSRLHRIHCPASTHIGLLRLSDESDDPVGQTMLRYLRRIFKSSRLESTAIGEDSRCSMAQQRETDRVSTPVNPVLIKTLEDPD